MQALLEIAGLRDVRGRQGGAALRRAEAARGHRARPRAQPAAPPARRGHLRPRRRVGEGRAGAQFNRHLGHDRVQVRDKLQVQTCFKSPSMIPDRFWEATKRSIELRPRTHSTRPPAQRDAPPSPSHTASGSLLPHMRSCKSGLCTR